MEIAVPLYVGHSHLAALMGAAKRQMAPLSFFSLRGMMKAIGPDDALPPEFSKSISGRTIVSVIGGNAHNLFGLLKVPPPFDFIIQDNLYQDVPTEASCQLIPHAVLRDALLKHARKHIDILAKIAPRAARVIHMESPPPVEDDAYILEHANRIFAERGIDDAGIVSALLRLKLWRLHSAIMLDACKTLGVLFIPVPPETVDRGFLRPEFIADPSHGNAAYGELVLQQIASL